MSKEPLAKIYLILEKIEYIDEIVTNSESITQALDDVVATRPAILMHLTSIAEQFNKLKQENQTELLNYFDHDDIKGLYDTRTYIAHEYEGVNLSIIEWIIRHGLPKFKNQCLVLIEDKTD